MSYQQADFASKMDRSYQSAEKINEQVNTENNIFSLTKKKIPLNAIYFICFWNFGICVAIFGSTLLDLACQTSSSLSSMSFLYFLQNFMSLVGCFFSGMLVKKRSFEMNDLLMISSLIMPICVSLMPFTKNIVFLGLLMIVLGFNMGCIDNIANLAILKLHGANVSPFMQAMHFFYGIGAFLTPVIVNTFLNKNFDFTITSSTFKCYNLEEVSTNFPEESTSFMNKSNEILPSFQTSKSSENYTDIETQEKNSSEISASQNTSLSIESIKDFFFSNPFLRLILLISILVFLFEGLQAIHGGYIYSYTVEKFQKEKSKFSSIKNVNHKLIVNRHHSHHIDDAYITAAFWAFFSIGRLVSIFLATKFSSSFMLLLDIIGCFLACLIMILSSAFASLSLLYTGTCLLGLFLSNTTPTSYSLAEIHIGMTPTLTSFVIICAASGEMIFPLIVAFFFEHSGSNSFIAIELMISIVISVTFVRFFFITKTSSQPRSDFIWSNTPYLKEVNMIENTSNSMCYSKMEENDSD
ncbi:Major facilitator superfamily domain-containing 4 [Brachionus plicatilis]|uniref:Major facilitator superfamily domain-containing 4 n=1 Tax=Brachionus plicatilis TaxID=10195 RepID=A0A3M7SUQ2_BRAPC|nr:Major facilitator superfamily domain-containing 4 [Brachionus plicatilis]